MLRISPSEKHIFEYSATLPLERVLAKLAGLVKKGTRFRVLLSGALCSAISIKVPSDIKAFNEIQMLTKATAVQMMGGTTAQHVCEVDPKSRTLAGVIPAGMLDTLTRWMNEQGCTLVSLRPLWAVASQMARVQNTDIHGFVLSEPDGCILVLQTKNNDFQTTYWGGEVAHDVFAPMLKRALVGYGAEENSLLRFEFSAKQQTLMENPPKLWSQHWAVV